MGLIGLFFLAAIAVAADVEDCAGAVCPAGAGGASLLQHAGTKVKSDMLAAQQLERETKRRGSIVESMVDRRLIILASMVREGMSEADAVSVIKTLAEEFDVTDGEFEDLSSTSNLKDLLQWCLVPLHDMICQVRKEEAGCDTEWKEYLDDALDVLSSIRASMVQLVVGGQRGTNKEEAHSISEKGQADEKVVLLLKEHMRRCLMIIVKSGEEPASALQMASEVMQKLKNMDDSSLLAYAQDSKAKLSKKYFLSVLRTACLPTTNSCADLLCTMVWAADKSSNGQTTLLQVVVRPAVALVMRFYGLPEVPDESAAERAEATKAYLEQRGFGSS